MRHSTLLALACALLPATAASGAELAPNSREYKLMLEPKKFSANDPAKAVAVLWEQTLKQAIAQSLGPREQGGPRHKGAFKEGKQRRIVFRDTGDCVLTRHGYTLRERTKLEDGQPVAKSREATLKFRIADNIIAASAHSGEADDKFEEDIAPLLRAGGKGTGFARPPSMRSMFSVSMDRDPKAANQLLTFADASAIYPDLQERLAAMGAARVSGDAKLKAGAIFHEVVFEGAEVDIGKDLEAEIDVSLWYADGTFGSKPPRLAELSFKYKVKDAGKPAAPARRAFKLFTALQTRLGDWASPEADTKTSAALPDACR
jgi:hypothetical protein